MGKVKHIFAIGFILVLGMLVIGQGSSVVSAKTIGLNFANESGRVVDITSKKITYREQLGSSPEKWSKPYSIKINSKTKYYKCTGYNSSYTKYKLKPYSKTKAKSIIYNNGSNYVFFKTKNGKATMVVFGMENFVG